MKRTKKVYLPLWLAWFSQVFVFPMWGFLTYQVFFTEKGQRDPGVVGWVVLSVVFVAMSVMLLLMGYRKLPAYIVEEEDN